MVWRLGRFFFCLEVVGSVREVVSGWGFGREMPHDIEQTCEAANL